MDCGHLESPTAGGSEIDTAVVDDKDVTVECETTIVSTPAPYEALSTRPGSFGAPVLVCGSRLGG